MKKVPDTLNIDNVIKRARKNLEVGKGLKNKESVIRPFKANLTRDDASVKKVFNALKQRVY